MLTIENFLPVVKEKFVLELEGIGKSELELTSATELPVCGRPDMKRKPFSLIFEAPLLGPDKNMYLSQRTYRLEHDQLGPLDIFIVPIGPKDGLMRYEAVFN